MAFTFEKSIRMFPKKGSIPWAVRLLSNDGRQFVSISSPVSGKVVILETMAETDFDNIAKLLELAIEPEITDKWGGGNETCA